MIKQQINLTGASVKRINAFCKVLNKLHSYNVTQTIKAAHKHGFNPVLDRTNGQLIEFVCRTCGKPYHRLGWITKHQHQ